MRICCFKDANGQKDYSVQWTRRKIGMGIFIWTLFLTLIIWRGFVTEGGCLGFSSFILVVYHFVTVIAVHLKPEGVYHLCKGHLDVLRMTEVYRMIFDSVHSKICEDQSEESKGALIGNYFGFLSNLYSAYWRVLLPHSVNSQPHKIWSLCLCKKVWRSVMCHLEWLP